MQLWEVWLLGPYKFPICESREPSSGKDGISPEKQQVLDRNCADSVALAPPRWRRGHGRASHCAMRAAIFFLVAVIAAPAFAKGGSVIAAGGHWAAILRDGQCDAESLAMAPATARSGRGLAGFTFAADRSRWGQFHARLSRAPRAGASVIATIGRQPFLLTARGGWAWSTGPAQEMALMAAIRSADSLRIQSRDSAGRRFTDRFALDFAPTAIDAAAARCSRL